MLPGRSGAIAALTVLLTAAGASAQSEPVAPQWEIALGGQVGAPRGFVKVGEHDRSGDLLRLHQDLGIDTFEAAQLGGVYRLTPRDTLRARFDYTFLYGGTTIQQDTAFNGATLAGGTHLQTRPVFTRVSGMYEHQFVTEPSGFTLAGGIGLTWAYLHFKLHGTLASATIGKETQEDFYAQELPVPLLGLRAEYPLTERLQVTTWVDGGFLPRVDSLRTEGGTVTLSQGHADVFLGMSYAVTPALRIESGYAYTYFTQHETSGEDDNNIVFLGHAISMDLTYRF